MGDILHGIYGRRGRSYGSVGRTYNEEPATLAPAPIAAPAPTQEPVTAEPEQPGYDPGEFSVAEVLEWLATHPEQAAAIVDLERAGKARKTILSWL